MFFRYVYIHVQSEPFRFSVLFRQILQSTISFTLPSLTENRRPLIGRLHPSVEHHLMLLAMRADMTFPEIAPIDRRFRFREIVVTTFQF